MIRYLLILTILLSTFRNLEAQPCTTLGQTPETAFPVCGSQPFGQTQVPPCGGTTITAPGCTNAALADLNPYWYKFTCFTSGTLGFTITPVNPSDDYDWQLFDVTNHSPNEVYTNSSLFVACNWSGEVGTTGASAAGNSLIVCATSQGSPYRPLFSAMPNVVAGHNYILLISHFSGSDQSGYDLTFTGGSSSIIDPLPPHVSSASASCDAETITIKLNKKMKCKTLAPDGSDFSIDAAGITITSATGHGCNRSFDMDSVTLTLSAPLPPGNYLVAMKNGLDGNTIGDNCDRFVAVNESLPLTIYPKIPTPMDSLVKPGCSPQTLTLKFRKNIKCSSIAADGSDFSVIGPYPVTVTGATGECSDGLSSSITVQLAAPMQVHGNFIIRLNKGSDGNTILDECDQETPAGSFIAFSVKDTVNADFTYNITYGCQRNVVQYFHNGANTVNSWLWNFDGTVTSAEQNPMHQYQTFNPKNTTLIVSNGVCSDTSGMKIYFDNYLYVDFEITSLVCPNDKAVIKNKTVSNNVITWDWDFGNGITGSVKDPAPQSYEVRPDSYYAHVKLFVINSYGCKDSTYRYVQVINNCYIAVPSAFSPNNDGLNDYLYPLNAYKAKNLSFSIYNRFGQRIFYTTDWTNKWDGTFKGQGVDPGTYVWILRYFNPDTNRNVEQKGSTVLIR